MTHNNTGHDDLENRHNRALLALDVDDVLADFREAFVRVTREISGIDVRSDEYSEDWRSLWGTDELTTRRLATALKAPDFMLELLPLPGSQKAITDLAGTHDLIALTSRSTKLLDVTEQWLKIQYGSAFQKIVPLGFWDDLSGQAAREKSKGEICKELGVQLLIDDQLKHCLSCSRLGILSILFGANTDVAYFRSTLILPAPDWPTVVQLVRSQHIQQVEA